MKNVEVPLCVVQSAIQLLDCLQCEVPGFYEQTVLTMEALRRCVQLAETKEGPK